VSGHNAFEEDMDQELENFIAALKEGVSEQPDPRIASSLVARLAETARASHEEAASAQTAEQPAARRPRSRSRLVMPARVAFAAGLLIASMATLAVAHVKLPDAVGSGFKKVGITLPNQKDKPSPAVPATPATPAQPNAPTTGGDQGHGPKAGGSNGHHKGKKKKHKQHSPGGHGQSGASHGKGNAHGKKQTPPGQAKPTPPPHVPSKGSKSQSGAHSVVPPPSHGKGKTK
jgi:hypothetical protein